MKATSDGIVSTHHIIISMITRAIKLLSFGAHNAIINTCLFFPPLDGYLYQGKAGSWGGENNAGEPAQPTAPYSALMHLWWEKLAMATRMEPGVEKNRALHIIHGLETCSTKHPTRLHQPHQMGHACISPHQQVFWSLLRPQNTSGSSARELLWCQLVFIISVQSGKVGDAAHDGRETVRCVWCCFDTAQRAFCNKEIIVARTSGRFRTRESHWVIHIWSGSSPLCGWRKRMSHLQTHTRTGKSESKKVLFNSVIRFSNNKYFVF